jgi:hypothetical protein
MHDCGVTLANPGHNMITITNRWHWLCKPGRYLVTFAWEHFARNVDAVVDDFGNLIPVKA